MVKKTSTRRVMVGDPEHVINSERAKTLLANRMKFTPDDLDSRAVTHALLGDDPLVRAERFGRDIGAADGFGKAADKLSDKVIDRLSNNGQFNRFTLESIASMTPAFIEAVANPEDTQALSNAISQQPASNGKTYTTYQLLRTDKAVLSPADYAEALDYTVKDARYARSWAQGNFKMTVPRGDDVRDSAVRASLSEFSNIKPDVQDFVAKLYSETGNSQLLDQRLDRYHGDYQRQELDNNLTGKPIIQGDGAHGTNEEYDFEESDLMTSAGSNTHHELDNNLTGKPVIQGTGPHGTNDEYDFEEFDLTVGLDNLSDEASVSQEGPQQ